MTQFRSILWLSNIPLCIIYHVFLTRSSVDRHLVCFRVLATENSVAMNMWNLEKQYRWTHVQGSEREADVESGCADMVGDELGNWHWYMYTATCRTGAAESLLISTGSPLWCEVMPERDGMGVGRGGLEGGAMCTHIADSFCCTTETNATL